MVDFIIMIFLKDWSKSNSRSPDWLIFLLSLWKHWSTNVFSCWTQIVILLIRQLNCLFNSMFRLTTQKHLKLCITGPLLGESCSDQCGFPSQRASNVESITMWWHHPDIHYHSNRLVLERRNSSALAMEFRLSCINPSIHRFVITIYASPGNGCQKCLIHANIRYQPNNWRGLEVPKQVHQ